MPTDIFVIPTQKENGAIPDFQMQSIDPLSSIKEAYRISVFGVQRTQVVEREAEVLAVDMTIKRCSDLNYFSNQDVMTQYGTRDWVSVICRIPDFHAGTPDPDQTLAAGATTTTTTFKEITRMRSCIGKFYAPMDDLRAKGIMNIEVGDRVIVEFQDKTKFENGIIKEIFAKKNVATYVPTGGGGAGGAFAPGSGAYPAGGGIANVENPSLAQEFFTLLAMAVCESPTALGRADVAQATYNRYAYNNGQGSRGVIGYGGKNIASLVTAQTQYEPTFCNKNDWRSIVDVNTAVRAIQNATRGTTGSDPPVGCNEADRQRNQRSRSVSNLKDAYAALSDPTLQAQAADRTNGVGGRSFFLSGHPRDWYNQVPVLERSPKDDHNAFFIVGRASINQIIDYFAAQPIPAHIKPLLDLRDFDQAVAMAMGGSPAGTTPPAGGTTPPAGGGFRTPFGNP